MKTHKLQFPILVPTNNRGIKNNDYCIIIKYTSFINNTDVYFQADRQTEILTVLWCALFAAKIGMVVSMKTIITHTGSSIFHQILQVEFIIIDCVHYITVYWQRFGWKGRMNDSGLDVSKLCWLASHIGTYYKKEEPIQSLLDNRNNIIIIFKIH